MAEGLYAEVTQIEAVLKGYEADIQRLQAKLAEAANCFGTTVSEPEQVARRVAGAIFEGTNAAMAARRAAPDTIHQSHRSTGRPRKLRRAIAYAVIEPKKRTASVIVVATNALLRSARPNGARAHIVR